MSRGSAPRGLRSRSRSDGSVRLWWEPTAEGRAKGFANVELEARTAAHEAARLNQELDAALGGGGTEEAGTVATRQRTLGRLIGLYRTSPDFHSLSAKSQREYPYLLVRLEDDHGPVQVRDITKGKVSQWIDGWQAGGHFTMARALKAMLSKLMSYAEKLEWRRENSNPCFRLGAMKAHPRRRVVADWDLLDLLVEGAEAWGKPGLAWAIATSALMGQRQTDVAEARFAQFTQRRVPGLGTFWIWDIRRSKRGTEGLLPLHDELVPRFLALRDAAPDGQEWVLPEYHGARISPQERLSGAFARLKRRLVTDHPEIAELQFRDLRRTFGAMARQAGIGREDVGDVLGNSVANDDQLADIYLPPQLEGAFRAVRAVKRPRRA